MSTYENVEPDLFIRVIFTYAYSACSEYSGVWVVDQWLGLGVCVGLGGAGRPLTARTLRGGGGGGAGGASGWVSVAEDTCRVTSLLTPHSLSLMASVRSDVWWGDVHTQTHTPHQGVPLLCEHR